jgi:hypothetical protein
MFTKLRTAITRLRKNEDGWVSPFSLFFSLGLLSFGGVAYEYAETVRQKTQYQQVTDAVALAAVTQLPDREAAIALGMQVAAKYFPNEETPVAVTAADFQFGTWDEEGKAFSTSDAPATAVAVMAVRSKERKNVAYTAFRAFTQSGDHGLRTRSVARVTEVPFNACARGGFISGGYLTTGSHNSFGKSFCTYGASGMEIGNNNYYESAASLQGGRSATFSYGGSNNCGGSSVCELQTPGPDDADKRITLPLSQDYLEHYLQAGDTSIFRDGNMYTIRHVSKLPKKNKLVPYTAYIVNGDAEFSSNGNYENLIVLADSGTIKAGANTTFHNVVLLADDDILFGSNTQFGDGNHCAEGRYQTYMFAEGNIELGSNNAMNAIQMAAKGTLTFGTNITSIGDIHGETWGDVIFNSNNSLDSCPDALVSDFGWAPDIQAMDPFGGTRGLVM